MKNFFLFLFILTIIYSCSETPKQENKSIDSADTLLVGDTIAEVPLNTDTNIEMIGEAQINAWAHCIYIDTILSNFDSCYKFAKEVNNSQGAQTDRFRQIGNNFYKIAGDYFVKLEALAYDNKEEIPAAKYEVIKNTLNFYHDIFNDPNILGHDFKEELEFYKINVKNWPSTESQIEKDYNHHALRIFISRQSKMKIHLSQKGTMCISEAKGVDKFTITGYLQSQNGYGEFEIQTKQLPISLDQEKTFLISNNDIESGLEICFERCERQ
jgi:hypothetical protein